MVGGRDDGQQVARVLVLFQQRHDFGADGRHDHFGHELAVQRFQAFARELRQGAQRKFQVFHRVERAGLVLREKFVVAAGEFGGVHGTDAYQEFAPLVIRVDGQQGVVEVKQGQIHHSFASACSNSRNKGKVIGRWVSRE